LRPFKGNVFYREKTFLRQSFFHHGQCVTNGARLPLGKPAKSVPLFAALR